MKILMVATNFAAPVGGGGQKSLKLLADSLVDAGQDVVVAALAHDKPGIQYVDGVKVHYLPVRNLYRPVDTEKPAAAKRMAWHLLDSYNRLAGRDLRAVCREEVPDVVHSHVITGLSVAVWQAARSLGLPVVHTLRDQYLLCARSTMFKNGAVCDGQCGDCGMLRLPHRSLSNKLEGVIGASRYILDHHLKFGFFRDVPVQKAVRNARTPESLGLTEVQPNGRNPEGLLRFGFIGSLAANKGVEELLKAFQQLAMPGVELWVAGVGEKGYADKLKKVYASPSVHFLGRVSQAEFYPQVDVVVVPSNWNDTLPGVVFEAMAFGCPVIGSRRGGIPEMIEHGENGLLYEPDRSEELPGALKYMVDHASEIPRMALVARKMAEPYLDIDRYVQEHLEIYERTVDTLKKAGGGKSLK